MRSISDEAGAGADLRKSRRVRATALDRLPPHDMQMEMGVISCMMCAPRECLPKVVLELGDKGDALYDLRNQTVYQHMVKLATVNKPIDLITIQDSLKTNNMLQQVGGLSYLSELQDAAPSAANVDYYLGRVKELYLLRLSIQVCSGVVGRIYDYEGEIDSLLSEMESEVLKVRQTFKRGRGRANISDIQQRLIQRYEDAFNNKVVAGLLTKYSDWNRKLGGFLGQEVIYVGGTPSTGKTTLVQNIAFGIAEAGTHVSFKSMETSAEKLVHRFNCMAGQVDSTNFLSGNIGQEEFMRMGVAIQKVSAAQPRLMIGDISLTDTELMASCRQDYNEGARLFVFDMLQNIQVPRAKDEYERVTKASQMVKRIAKDLDVPVICTSAMNRIEGGKKPTMANLRQSGQIESDGDKIILLHCEDRAAEIREVTADVVKNKDGPLGEIPFTFFASQFRFESAAVQADEDKPDKGHKKQHNND